MTLVATFSFAPGVNRDSSFTITCTSFLASSVSTALLSSNSKRKGYHTDGGRGNGRGRGLGHDD